MLVCHYETCNSLSIIWIATVLHISIMRTWLGQSAGQHAGYWKYAKILGLEKVLTRHYETFNFVFKVTYTNTQYFMYFYQCILKWLQFYYDARYCNCTDCTIIQYSSHICTAAWRWRSTTETSKRRSYTYLMHMYVQTVCFVKNKLYLFAPYEKR